MRATFFLAAIAFAAPCFAASPECAEFEKWVESLSHEYGAPEGTPTLVETDLAPDSSAYPFVVVTPESVRVLDPAVPPAKVTAKGTFDRGALTSSLIERLNQLQNLHMMAGDEGPVAITVAIAPDTPMSVVAEVTQLLKEAQAPAVSFALATKGKVLPPSGETPNTSPLDALVDWASACKDMKGSAMAVRHVAPADTITIIHAAFQESMGGCACSLDLAAGKRVLWSLSGRDRRPPLAAFTLTLGKGQAIEVNGNATWANSWKQLQTQANGKPVELHVAAPKKKKK